MEDLHSDKELDKMFREGLEGFEMEPSEKVWETIEQRLNKKSRKPKFIFWLSALIGILLIGTTLVCLKLNGTIFSEKNNSANTIALKPSTVNTNSTSGVIKNNTSVTENKNTTTTANSNVTTTENNSSEISSTKPIANNSNNKITTVSNATTVHVQAQTVNSNTEKADKIYKNNPGKNSTTSGKNVAPVNNIDSAVTVVKPEKKNKLITNNTAKTKNNSSVNTNDSVSKVAYIKPVKSSSSKKQEKNTNDNNTKNNSTTNQTIVESKTNTKSETKQPDINNSAIIKAKEPVKNNEPNLITPGLAETTMKSIDSTAIVKTSTTGTDSSITKNNDSTLVKKDSTLTTANDSSKNKIIPPVITPFSAVAISTYFSPDFFIPKITSTESTFNSSAESHNIRYSFGLKGEYRPVHLLGIQLGLAYSEISQQSSVQRIMFDKNISTPYSIYGSLGEMQVDPDIMKDGFSPLAPVPQFWTNMQYSQKVSFINIPLNVKLHFGKKKINFTFSGGLNTQYAIKQKSQVTLIKEHFNNVINYTDVKVNRLNYAALAGLGIEYKFAKRFSIYIEPSVRYNISNISKTSSISNKPIILGVNTGITLHIR